MLDGIKYAIINSKSEDDLLAELSKNAGEVSQYLEKERAYRSEEDVFEDFTEEERETYFGKAPATVYENLLAFEKYPDKIKVLKDGGIFTDKIINSFKLTAINRWVTEITNRLINNYAEDIRSYKMLHFIDKALDLDISNWMKINELRHYIMKDTYTTKSLFTRLKEAADNKNYSELSKLQLELDNKMSKLRNLYSSYKKNLLDI